MLTNPFVVTFTTVFSLFSSGRQPYLQNLFPSKSRTIFKCRSKTLDIKDHKPFKFKDILCRRCGSEREDLEHVVNCTSNSGDGLLKLDVMREDHDETHLLSVANRVERFFEEG